jgi:PAS domain S-box-containing protein
MQIITGVCLLKSSNNTDNNQLYRAIIQNAGDIILLLSISGDILYVNKEAVNSYGYTEEELLSMDVFTLRNQNKIDSVKEQFEKSKSGAVEFVTKHFRKDGSYFIAGVKATCIDVSNKKYVLSIVRDITERLKEKEEIYKLAYIIENSKDAIINITLENIISSWNKGAEELYGYAKYEVLGKNVNILFQNDRLNEIDIIINKIRKNEMIRPYETLRKKKNNVAIDVSSMVSPICDLEGIIIGASINERDITSKKETTREIETITIAMEQSASAIIITNIDGNMEYVNKKFELITGYKKDQLIGKSINILNSMIQYKDFFKRMWKIIKNGKEWKGEFYNKTKDGSLFWWDSSISPVKDEQGRIIKFLAVAEDITEKKNFIEEITQKNIDLEKALNSLKEIQMHLVQEDKMASVGQLSAGIAHEINNPLGFVSSNFNTLKKYMNNFKEYIFEYRKLKNTLSESCITLAQDEIEKINTLEENKMEYIINDLDCLFEDTENGLNRIKKIVISLGNFAHENSNDTCEDYSLNQGIEDTLVIAQNELKYVIDIKINLITNIPLIKANPGEINQVLLNILLNSSYSIKEKKKKYQDYIGELNIKTWNDDDFVYCSIEDNGIGMPKENINKVFNPFFTTKPIGKGTGLGLSISYNIIVNKHKGDIKLESIVGKGTKFTLILPISKEVFE